MAERVFVCSTCYDLIDLRAELEQEIRDLGLAPLMSDRASTEFGAEPDVNSIESCLANVRSADVFVMILSQRYGPSLEKAGYKPISATHLEYKEARDSGKPIHVYVRDRLEADYAIWKRNREREGGPVNLAWVKKGDEGIFQLLEEHRELRGDASESNWFWTFTDSVDLRDRMRADLGGAAGRAALERLVRGGRAPLLLPQQGATSFVAGKTLKPSFYIRNIGTATAIDVQVTAACAGRQSGDRVVSLEAGAQTDHTAQLSPGPAIDTGEAVVLVSARYTTPEAYEVEDQTQFTFSWDPSTGGAKGTSWQYLGKVYHGSSGYGLRTAGT